MNATTFTTTATTMAKKNQKMAEKLTLKKPVSSNGSVASSSNGSFASSKKDNNNNNKNSSKKNGLPADTNNEGQSLNSDSSSNSSNEVVVVKSQSPPWKATFDYLADQAFNAAGFAYLSAIGGMAWYFMRQSNIDFLDEFTSALTLMITHKNGANFFGMLTFMILLRSAINKLVYPIVLNHIYDGKNHKYTAHYCEWLFDAIKNTVMFTIGFYVAWGSDWWPMYQHGRLGWYPKQGGTIFDSDGEIVPTCALALETIGHFEVTVDFVALLTLVWDAVTEYYEAQTALLRHGQDEKQATTTTSFAEDFVHHTGVCFGALFLYITAKDNCNAIAIIVLLGQFNDMCEFAALSLGLCKVWVLERVVTPILCVFWTISLFYIWPAALIPIFLEPIPIEHSFDSMLVLQLTLYQFGSIAIASLFWAMHMFWLYKGLLFLYRYQRGVYFAEKKLKFKKDKGEHETQQDVPQYGRTACLASGTMLKPTKEE
ncbi:expressed unknown protein [Seminavis robusta]|uniref:TLC domain-containing protein n=1 Tax=Seminavis robusta TaxID=568900 RepID=A0A9N8DMN5_9STRA|nr:expressed unknown protein [Seminavis robusta]|eukprot:Sro164_g073650.1 n/a (484) ;mRNA; r:60677-62128